jgi:tetratricopeptide (TPR) repeat protein
VALDDPWVTSVVQVYAMLAEPVAAIADAAMAGKLYQGLVSWSAPVISYGRSGMSCGGPTDLALGLLAHTCGRIDQAARHFERALEVSSRANLQPYQVQARHWYARLLLERRGPGDAERARTLIDEGQALAGTLGLETFPRRLAQLQAPASAPPAARASAPLPAAPAFTFVREGDYWTVRSGEAVCRLKDSRGVQMLAELCAQPGREFHVLALSGGGGDDGGALAGDAGEALDAEAMADYRARVEELDEEIAEAESFGDPARASRAQEERAAIARELAQGVGLGGRARRVGGAAERARTNVQRRIRGAIKKIGETIPALGAYLDRTVRTGTFCSYEPL